MKIEAKSRLVATAPNPKIANAIRRMPKDELVMHLVEGLDKDEEEISSWSQKKLADELIKADILSWDDESNGLAY
jgi:hypothetical protein